MSQPPVDIVEHLIAALDDPNQDIRIEAHDDLARLQGAQAVEALLRLPKGAGSFLRGDLLVNLAYAHDPRALPILTAALKDRSSAVRARAVYALRIRLGLQADRSKEVRAEIDRALQMLERLAETHSAPDTRCDASADPAT
jgi:HEAT repeat protein